MVWIIHCNIASFFSICVAFWSVWLFLNFTGLILNLGIVLKNAKLTKKGRSKSNVESGKIVETLVILSSNIVQIVAEVGLFFYGDFTCRDSFKARLCDFLIFIFIGSLAFVQCCRGDWGWKCRVGRGSFFLQFWQEQKGH